MSFFCISLVLLWSIYPFHVQEHCLMGIKGTVRRSTDGHVIHANIDTDIIIAEEPTDGIFPLVLLVLFLFFIYASCIYTTVLWPTTTIFNDEVHTLNKLIFSKFSFLISFCWKWSSLFCFYCCHGMNIPILWICHGWQKHICLGFIWIWDYKLSETRCTFCCYHLLCGMPSCL